MLKIYPCLVTPGTQLHEEWKRGEYRPYSTEKSARLIGRYQTIRSALVRIMRIQREIPVDGIADGVKHVISANRRARAHESEYEVSLHQMPRGRDTYLKNARLQTLERVELKRIDYEGPEGLTIFLSIEDPEHDILVGYVRIRIPTKKPTDPNHLSGHSNHQGTTRIRADGSSRG